MINLGLLSDRRASRSLSPAMHRAALQAAGLAGAYTAFAVAPENLGPAVQGLAALGFLGANVTVPHKETVMPFLTSLSDEARTIGAVNTLVAAADGGFAGHNTDAGGFLAALAEVGRPSEKNALVVGAGGAARAVLYALRREGFQVRLVGRDAARTRRLAAAFAVEPATFERPEASRWPLLVNCSAASAPEELGATLAWLKTLRLAPGALVMDLNYGRADNAWAGLAARQGGAFQDGLAMLAAQARLSFQLWLGRAPELALFKAALEDRRR